MCINCFFFFKQKTAYEVRISDWSSDVCSSDLPDTEVISTIGAKEGFSHLMWVLLEAGDVAIVPSPSYPIHIWGPLFAGAAVREIPMTSEVNDDGQFLERIRHVFEPSWPRPRVIVCSFPHNTTTTGLDPALSHDPDNLPRRHGVMYAHTNTP